MDKEARKAQRAKRRAERMRRLEEEHRRELHVDDISELEGGALLSAEESQAAPSRTFADDVAEAGRLGIEPKSSIQDVKPTFLDEFLRKGAAKREAYNFIVAKTGDGIDEEAEEWINHYYVARVQGLTAAFVVALVCGVIGVVIGNYAGPATLGIVLSWMASFVAFAAVVCFAMVSVTRKRILGKIVNTMDNARDPQSFCARYLGYLKEKDPKDLTQTIWNYARGLRWQGRWKDAIALFDAYIEDFGLLADAPAEHLYHQLLAGCAFDRGRLQEMGQAIEYAESIPETEVGDDVASGLGTLRQLQLVLELEREGKRQEAYDLVESFFYQSENVLRMALALHLGTNSNNRNDALEWIGFVVKMGETTWCVKRAKAIRSSGQLQKLPAGESRFGRNPRERRREERQKRKEAAKLADDVAEAERSVENMADIPR